MAEKATAFINYYARKGLGHHIQSVCTNYIEKSDSEAYLLFWHAYGLMVEGFPLEALREFKNIENRKDMQLGVIVALLHIHQLSTVVDGEKINQLYSLLESAGKTASENALINACTLYWHLGGSQNIKMAKYLLQRLSSMQPQQAQVQILKGWIEVYYEHGSILKSPSDISLISSASIENALNIFDRLLAKGSNIEAFLGKASCYELLGDYSMAMDTLQKVTRSYPWFDPATCEEARMALLMQKWDLVLEITKRILDKDSMNIEGLLLQIYVMLCSAYNATTINDNVSEIIRCIELKEPQNANIYFQD